MGAMRSEVQYALPISGGVTLYVAASDLIPEVNREPGVRIAILVFLRPSANFSSSPHIPRLTDVPGQSKFAQSEFTWFYFSSRRKQIWQSGSVCYAVMKLHGGRRMSVSRGQKFHLMLVALMLSC